MFECLSETEIAALVANLPPERDRASIASHLQTCEQCRIRLKTAREQSPSASHETVVLPHAPHSAPALSIDGYEILQRVHGGGQGVVYKAIQKSTSRLVAVKILPHEESASTRQKQRFEREISLAASLRHPGIVTIYDSGLTSGRYFFAMEYIHGKPLDEHARALPQRDKLLLFSKVCDAVAHAHQRNIIHRDLKPGNVLVDARGEPHVLDFGLAKSSSANVLADDGSPVPLTLTSQFMGTLAYASPEQTMGDPSLVDRRSDVYALGVMLYELLTGAMPYKMPGDLVGTFQAIRHVPPTRPSHTPGGAGLPNDLDTIVLRALAKEPNRRYPSAEDLAADIHRYLAGQPISARRDSVLYVTSTKGKAALRRHPILTSLAIIALMTLVAGELASNLLRLWPAPGRWFEFAAGASRPESAAAGVFERVRIAAITEETERAVAEISRTAGLDGVTSEQWKSMRRLHGHLMQRLAAAEVGAVVWDIAFEGETEFDADFASGVKSLLDAGAGVVVGIVTWDVPDPTNPPIAPAIRDARVLWGGNSLNVDDVSAWKADLVVRQPGGPALPSLSLAAFAALQHPGMDVVTHLDDHAQQVAMQFRAMDSRIMQAPRASLIVPLSAVRPAGGTENDEFVGLKRGAMVGLFALSLPDPSTFEAATLSYHDVLNLSDEALKSWCSGRAVVICDNRSDETGNADRYPAAGGRMVWGGEGHATVVDALIRGAAPARYPGPGAYTLAIAAAAFFGLIMARMRLKPALSKPAAVIAAAAGLTIVSIAAFRWTGYLLNPAAPILALVLAFLAWWWLDRLHTWRVQ